MEELEERVYCSRCKGKTKHLIITSYCEQSEGYTDFHWHDKYHIVQCAGCDNKSFVRQYGDEDTWQYVDGYREWKDIFTVYPEEPKVETSEEIWKRKFEQMHFIPAKIFKYVPENLNNLYKQTINSYNSQHNILCAAGLRTIIEGVCNQVNIKKGYIYEKDGSKKLDKKQKEIYTDNLAGRIFGLYENGLIIFIQALLLQKIKNIGNSAVHDIVEPSIETLKQTIEIIETILYNIYELGKHDLLSE
ncbi:DUF4145 domain-containing protein [Peribacillus frigoritolerans]|uniref:DUF4145 domain-containing protein n=1 Tax=Peribacillus frigoritolerans TaxID=450367 RepID=UPI0025710C3D|nr:DUF4145 domain-containing protein [Peribacillus frigoritolerans]WJE49895.1 DUF4145 domain-containing protein [Peribacillus frigoritolerans]